MPNKKNIISACLVVYNEEQVIQTCLESIKGIVDEIIIIHDGECKDKTLEIAKKYTQKIFTLPHIGIAEPHRSFALNQAKGDWILQIDADEYLDTKDHRSVRGAVDSAPPEQDAFLFKWEMWDEKKPHYIAGVQKMCLFRKKNFSFIGIPQEIGRVKGSVQTTDFILHHRPAYNNLSWKNFLRKAKKWVPIHARYFFPQMVRYECFNTTPDSWVQYTHSVKKHMLFYIIFYPLKTLLAQLKNGLWRSLSGINIGLQQFFYYLNLYWRVWKIKKYGYREN